MIGEVKSGLELGKPHSRRYHKYIYHACMGCGKERWTTFDHSEVQSPRCKSCENRFKSKSNPALYKKGIGNGLTYEEKTWLKNPEYLREQSISHKGKISPLRGIKRPIELVKRISVISKGKHYSPKSEFKKGQFAKEKHPFWKGGVTKESRLIRGSKEFKEWRKKVFERDNYTCQKCFKQGVFLHPHHIKEFSKYPEIRFNLDNGITLCKECHHKLHKKGGDANGHQTDN